MGVITLEVDGRPLAVPQVREHMEVVGSDGEHVGTVDTLRGDRIILTKSDSDAGGVHRLCPHERLRQPGALPERPAGGQVSKARQCAYTQPLPGFSAVALRGRG